MRRLDERIIAALTEARPKDVAEEAEARFFIRAWMWATPLLLLFLALYVLNGMRFQGVLQASCLVAGGLLLAAYARGKVSVVVLGQGSLGITAASFSLSSLGQTPYDVSSIFLLPLVPLIAGFVGGFRSGIRWGLVVAALGLTSLALGYQGFTFPDPDPAPHLTTALNFVFQVLLSLVFARTATEERERALLKARAADRAKSVFLANVSHEIRTPMNGVVGMTEVLLQGQLSPAQRSQLEVIQRSGQSLVLLINDLLDVARLEEGRFELIPVRFDLQVLTADLAGLYQPLAAARGLSLLRVLGGGVPTAVRGDALRLRQVLSNLLSNAVKFTATGEVRLEVTQQGRATRFAVVDTGPGISEEVRPRLFQRFEQGDASATRRSGGTGLGLALSREFVSRMGGTLELDAAHRPGARFTFAVELPPVASLEEAAASPGPALRAGAWPVLVVDDNPINLAVARGLVGNAGFEVSTASNGREALQAIQSAPCSLVLMDVQMPEMDGLEAARQIRALPGAPGQVPIIALTASAMPEDVSACRAAGMDEVLAKPIDVEALGAILGRYLGAARDPAPAGTAATASVT